MDSTDFQPLVPFAQAVTVAYEPLDFTVMTWVALPAVTGTGKFGAWAAALVGVPPGADPGVAAPATARLACADGDFTVSRVAEGEADPLADADAEGEAEGEPDPSEGESTRSPSLPGDTAAAAEPSPPPLAPPPQPETRDRAAAVAATTMAGLRTRERERVLGSTKWPFGKRS